MTRVRVVRVGGENRSEASGENRMVQERSRVKNPAGFRGRAGMLGHLGEGYSDACEIALGTWTGK